MVSGILKWFLFIWQPFVFYEMCSVLKDLQNELSFESFRQNWFFYIVKPSLNCLKMCFGLDHLKIRFQLLTKSIPVSHNFHLGNPFLGLFLTKERWYFVQSQIQYGRYTCFHLIKPKFQSFTTPAVLRYQDNFKSTRQKNMSSLWSHERSRVRISARSRNFCVFNHSISYY